jgi:hypothetical protein
MPAALIRCELGFFMRKEHRNISFYVHRLDQKRWEWVVYLNTGEDVGFAGTEGDEEKATATAKAEIDAYLGKLESPRADEPAIMPARRFPPPWTVEEQDACFVVVDHSGQKLAYIYFEEEAGRRSPAKLLTKDEARRIAVNMAKLPQLLLGF